MLKQRQRPVCFDGPRKKRAGHLPLAAADLPAQDRWYLTPDAIRKGSVAARASHRLHRCGTLPAKGGSFVLAPWILGRSVRLDQATLMSCFVEVILFAANFLSSSDNANYCVCNNAILLVEDIWRNW